MSSLNLPSGQVKIDFFIIRWKTNRVIAQQTLHRTPRMHRLYTQIVSDWIHICICNSPPVIDQKKETHESSALKFNSFRSKFNSRKSAQLNTIYNNIPPINKFNIIFNKLGLSLSNQYFFMFKLCLLFIKFSHFF